MITLGTSERSFKVVMYSAMILEKWSMGNRIRLFKREEFLFYVYLRFSKNLEIYPSAIDQFNNAMEIA